MVNSRPFSQACENNKTPILEYLKRVFADSRQVLEIGSGTGQHACHFAQALPHLVWQCSDLAINHPGINAWIDACPAGNLRRPLALDAQSAQWAAPAMDAVFTANTLHIISWQGVERLFGHLSRLVEPGGVVAVYGPFNYRGEYTSVSNARFDAWLKQQNPTQGIRDFEGVDALARGAGMNLIEDNAMPANNRLLVWRRSSGG